MQALQEFMCCECRNGFKSAAALLQHFALHATNSTEAACNKDRSMTLRQMPDLHPINFAKSTKHRKEESDLESDSGVEDVNPMKFCLVTMAPEASAAKRKYQCTYCSKNFGWPTDLKRHILIHTGEKPFECQHCDCKFTRNFLLKKHQRKCHSSDEIPDLKPIIKSRKQDKSSIRKRNTTEG